MRKPYKSVATCPTCGGNLVLIRSAKKEQSDDDNHLITHYSECRTCNTRCRTVTHSVVITRGIAPQSPQSVMEATR
jgi:ssDNA-binding Zn-finger/Zn-ribbon topoisomerase 1